MVSRQDAVEEGDEAFGHPAAAQRAIQMGDQVGCAGPGFDIRRGNALHESSLQSGRRTLAAGIPQQHVEFPTRIQIVEKVPADGMAWTRRRGGVNEAANVHRAEASTNAGSLPPRSAFQVQS